MTQKKLIVSDIDGTLLNSAKHITDKTKSKIIEMIDSGHLFAVATGRMHAAGRTITKEIDYDGFLISCNGAVVKHLKTGEVIQAIEVPIETVKKVAEICEKNGAIYFLYTIETIYASAYKHLAKKYYDEMPKLPEHLRFEIVFPEQLTALIGQFPVYKVAMAHENREMFYKTIDEIKALGDMEAVKSLDSLFDVMAKGVSKATGIEAIRSHYGLPLEDVIAFGDNENDIDMISYAGVGVAMSNATDELKAVANLMTLSNDEDGIVHALDLLGVH